MLVIRKADTDDAAGLMELYIKHLTRYPPKESQSFEQWSRMLSRFHEDDNYHILVGVEGDVAVSSVTLIIIENLTHNMRPYALIENVVTHADYRGRGCASALMEEACGIAAARGCYKVMLMTGSKKESTLRFYERCGFNSYDKTGFIRRLS